MGATTFAVFAERDRFPTGLVESAESTPGRRVLEQGYGPWPDANAAMDILGDQDRYENGHMSPDNVGGKWDLVHIATVDDDGQAASLAKDLIQARDPRIVDKRGPAGCITIMNGPHAFLFFGWVAT